jgi:hypothetical protein
MARAITRRWISEVPSKIVELVLACLPDACTSADLHRFGGEFVHVHRVQPSCRDESRDAEAPTTPANSRYGSVTTGTFVVPDVSPEGRHSSISGLPSLRAGVDHAGCRGAKNRGEYARDLTHLGRAHAQGRDRSSASRSPLVYQAPFVSFGTTLRFVMPAARRAASAWRRGWAQLCAPRPADPGLKSAVTG